MESLLWRKIDRLEILKQDLNKSINYLPNFGVQTQTGARRAKTKNPFLTR